ncbi:MAG: hypothetical protein ACK5NK_04110 [Niabella sp.]
MWITGFGFLETQNGAAFAKFYTYMWKETIPYFNKNIVIIHPSYLKPLNDVGPLKKERIIYKSIMEYWVLP